MLRLGKKEDEHVSLGLWTAHSVYDNGEVAMTSGVNFFDGRKGRAFHGFEITVFKDGSTIVASYKGTIDKRDESAGTYSSSDMTWEVLSGTGRMAGLKGGGVSKGVEFSGRAAKSK
jgi:hypothetical protein